jgi:hypothetical protein
MAFVAGFPARQPSGQTSLRVYINSATVGATFDTAGNSYVFIDQVGANPYTPLPVVKPGDDVSRKGLIGGKVAIPPNPAGTGENFLTDDPAKPIGQGYLTEPSVKAYIWTENMRIENTGAAPLEISFDGVNIHGLVPAGEIREYYGRREAAIAVRGPSGNTTFVLEAW